MAVSRDRRDWVLLNASPDIRQAVERYLRPPGGSDPVDPRAHPIRAVVLTDAQLDHATGLLLLRESKTPLVIYCTARVEADLRRGFPVLDMLGSYCGVEVRRLPIDGTIALEPLPDVLITGVPVPGKAPPYSPSRGYEEPGDNVALIITDMRAGRSTVYAPGLAAIDGALAERLAAADLAFVDGTFWDDDELERAGCGSKRASDMGHLPLGGELGLAARLGAFPRPRKVLVHMNNTNPALDERSPERARLDAAGISVAADGDEHGW